jgi:hypothetical protein
MTFTGRCGVDKDPLNRITITDVIAAIENQTDGLFKKTDFLPMPCPHPVCSASTVAFVDNKDVVPIPRVIGVDDYLDFVTNRATPDISPELQPALQALWNMSLAIGSDQLAKSLECVACGVSLPANFAEAIPMESFMMVLVHGFMDEHTFDLKRLMKCCIHQLLPDGSAVPFCAYNNLRYREQIKHTLGKQNE